MIKVKRKRILFIVNPTSGKMRIKNYLFGIIRNFSDAGYEPLVLMTAKRGDATEFARDYSKKVDVIAVCGGDGTLNEAVAGLMQLEKNDRCKLGFIPVGTTNDLADTLSLPKSPYEASKIILEHEPLPNDVGLFNDERFFNYVASCGAFTAASYSTPQNMKNSLGHMAYILEGIKSLNEIKPIKMKIESKEFSTEGDFLFAGVTNAMSVGGIYKFDPKFVCLDDGVFEVMLVRSPKNPADMVDLLYRLSNKDFDEKQVKFFKSADITFSFDSKVDWTVDGEYAGASDHINIKNIPAAVEIFKPAKK